MKMTKKVLFGAVAAVALIAGFTGCNFMDSVGHHKLGETKSMKFDNSSYDAGKGVWKIDGSNNDEEASNYLRGIDCLITKHFDMSAVVELTPSESLGPDGVIGVVLDASKEKKETEDGDKIDVWKFLNIGVRYNKTNSAGNTDVYVSYFKDVTDGADLRDGKSFGTETDISKGFVSLGDVPAVAIDAKQTDEGGYTISFYKADDVFTDSMANLKTEGVTPIKTINVTPAQVEKVPDADGNTKKEQKWCGAYTNIYINRTLEGKLQIVGLTKSPVDVDFE